MEAKKQNKEEIQSAAVTSTPKSILNIWKYMTLVLAILIIGVGAYLLGSHQAIPQSNVPLQQATITQTSPMVIPSLAVSPTMSSTITVPTSSSTPTPLTKKISAGIQTAVFTPYTLVVSTGWMDTHQTNPTGKTDTLTLTKAGSTLTISQVAGGAGGCAFPSDTPQPMEQVFTNVVGITGVSAQFRRGMMQANHYTVCENKADSFAFPTSFGYITYVISDQSVLPEMDAMVASLTK